MSVRSLALVVVLAASSAACGSGTPSAASPSTKAVSAPVDAHVTSADGVSLHYVVEGNGPTVVMVHCFGCNLHYWDVPAAELARDHRVVRLDLAGHGESGANRKTWTIEAFAGDVAAVVNAAGVDKFTLVGHSMAGPISLATALQLGDRVTGIVPIDTLTDVEQHMSDADRAKMVADMRADFHGGMDKILPRLMPKNPDPNVVERVRRDAMAIDPERGAAILDVLFAYREDQAMDHLSMPIVAVDSDLHPVAFEHNRAHAPQFDARVIPGTGHWLMFDKPTEFAHTLREVVESIETGKAKRRPA